MLKTYFYSCIILLLVTCNVYSYKWCTSSPFTHKMRAEREDIFIGSFNHVFDNGTTLCAVNPIYFFGPFPIPGFGQTTGCNLTIQFAVKQTCVGQNNCFFSKKNTPIVLAQGSFTNIRNYPLLLDQLITSGEKRIVFSIDYEDEPIVIGGNLVGLKVPDQASAGKMLIEMLDVVYQKTQNYNDILHKLVDWDIAPKIVSYSAGSGKGLFAAAFDRTGVRNKVINRIVLIDPVDCPNNLSIVTSAALTTPGAQELLESGKNVTILNIGGDRTITSVPRPEFGNVPLVFEGCNYQDVAKLFKHFRGIITTEMNGMDHAGSEGFPGSDTSIYKDENFFSDYVNGLADNYFRILP